MVIKYLKSLIFFFSFNILAFITERIIIIVSNESIFKNIPLSTLIKSFIVGLRFDISVSGYIILIPFIIVSYFWIMREKISQKAKILLNLYVFITTFVLISFIISDINYFEYFKKHLDAYALNIFGNEKMVIKMLFEMYPIWLYTVIVISISITITKIFSKLLNSRWKKEGKLKKSLISLILLILISIGIRGTLSYKTPLRWGHAFFSRYQYANILALNGAFNFISSIRHRKYIIKDELIKGIVSKKEAIHIVKNMIKDNSRFIDFPLREYSYQLPNRKYNIVIILLESFSYIGLKSRLEKGIKLYFPKLIKDGIYFSRCYSNGIHTYQGVFSSIFGLPNIISHNTLKMTEVQKNFFGIAEILTKNYGYTGIFGVSHDPNFDNMKGVLVNAGITKIVSQFDFPRKEVLSSLGVPDHRLFEKMNKVFKQAKKPFIGIILTTNNHGPWIIPKVKGKTFPDTYTYTDWALWHFINLAKKEKYFKNTIFLITADHGGAVNPVLDLDLTSFHIPCLIYAPHIIKTPKIIEDIMSQIDISETLLYILKYSHKTINLSKNLFKAKNHFAVVMAGKKLGIVTKKYYLIDRLNSKSSLYLYKDIQNLKDITNQKPKILKKLKKMLRSYMYISTKIITR